jgi:L-seryl-tRNA(Ser) seleniumtransferase
MKVGKEELLGILAAVEWSLALDEPALLLLPDSSVKPENLKPLPVWSGIPTQAA